MSRKGVGFIGLLLAIVASNGVDVPTAEAQRPARTAVELMETMLRSLDPDLLQRAGQNGIYAREDYPVLRSVNPFFVRGDFNGDGELDLAFWVTQRSSGLRGVAVVHSTLDRIYYLGAGHHEYGYFEKPGEVASDAWHVRPAGAVVHSFSNVPEIDAVEGRDFTLERETLEFVWLGKSAFVYYWANGRYWMIQTGD